MSSPDAPIPVFAIERQLRRMLASALFLANAQSARFFEFIVRSTLAGTRISEKDIWQRVYPDKPYSPDSPKVRVAKREVREFVNRYNETVGSADPIVITLPDQPKGPNGETLKFAPGDAYKVVFRRNERGKAIYCLHLAHHFLRQATPAALAEAEKYFKALDTQEPGNHESLLGRAEIVCLESL